MGISYTKSEPDLTVTAATVEPGGSRLIERSLETLLLLEILMETQKQTAILEGIRAATRTQAGYD